MVGADGGVVARDERDSLNLKIWAASFQGFMTWERETTNTVYDTAITTAVTARVASSDKSDSIFWGF